MVDFGRGGSGRRGAGQDGRKGRGARRAADNMKTGSRSIAKLTAPSGAELLKRERLFALLDAARAGKAAWIVAPGGAGKTSLAATWV